MAFRRCKALIRTIRDDEPFSRQCWVVPTMSKPLQVADAVSIVVGEMEDERKYTRFKERTVLQAVEKTYSTQKKLENIVDLETLKILERSVESLKEQVKIIRKELKELEEKQAKIFSKMKKILEGSPDIMALFPFKQMCVVLRPDNYFFMEVARKIRVNKVTFDIKTVNCLLYCQKFTSNEIGGFAVSIPFTKMKELSKMFLFTVDQCNVQLLKFRVVAQGIDRLMPTRPECVRYLKFSLEGIFSMIQIRKFLEYARSLGGPPSISFLNFSIADYVLGNKHELAGHMATYLEEGYWPEASIFHST